MTLAVSMSTLNAGEFLAPCLDAVGDHPVYICDEGSTDDTAAIARRYTNVTFLTNWAKFADGEDIARNLALDVVARTGFFTHVVRLDADEILTDGWYPEVAMAVAAYDPDCISVDYWQMVGRPIMSQIGNPLQSLRLVHKLAANPRYVPDATRKYHACIPAPANTLHIAPPAVIHLGYATKNLAARWLNNIARGDYSTRDDVNAQLRESMTTNPQAHLPPREPVPSELLAQSTYLTALANE